MSAPNEGRQSPDPERQTGAQQQATPAQGGSGKVREPAWRSSHKTNPNPPFHLSKYLLHDRAYLLTCVCNQLDESKDKNEGKGDQTANLESNPKHILADHADQTTSKTVS